MQGVLLTPHDDGNTDCQGHEAHHHAEEPDPRSGIHGDFRSSHHHFTTGETRYSLTSQAPIRTPMPE